MEPASAESRRNPSRPIVGVGAVIVDAGLVVLIKRKYDPMAGTWTLPGGVVEIGETTTSAAAREVREETGLIVDVGPVVEVVDRIMTDEDGRVAYHYVIVDYLCRPRGGELAAGSDVDEVALADPARLQPFQLADTVQAVIARALQMASGYTSAHVDP